MRRPCWANDRLREASVQWPQCYGAAGTRLGLDTWRGAGAVGTGAGPTVTGSRASSILGVAEGCVPPMARPGTTWQAMVMPVSELPVVVAIVRCSWTAVNRGQCKV